jgi:hypothetical protein
MGGLFHISVQDAVMPLPPGTDGKTPGLRVGDNNPAQGPSLGDKAPGTNTRDRSGEYLKIHTLKVTRKIKIVNAAVPEFRRRVYLWKSPSSL